MRYKKFKNAEIEVSQLAVGTWAIGGQNYGKVDKNEAIYAIRRMIEKGVNLIDTAPCYGNGTSEKIVGEVLKEIPREQVLISTKFGLIPDIYTHGYKKDTSYKCYERNSKFFDEFGNRLYRFLFCSLARCKYAYR